MKNTIALVVFIFVLCGAAFAQQQTHFFTPVLHGNQMPRGSAAANTGAVGLNVKKHDQNLVIEAVIAGGPAEKAGIRIGDVITAIDGKSSANWSEEDFFGAIRKNPGDSVTLTYFHDENNVDSTLTLVPRTALFSDAVKEANLPPGATQFFLDNWDVTAQLFQDPQNNSWVTLWLQIASNPKAPMMSLNAAKYFVLDGEHQQLNQITGEQVKYSVEQWLAQNWRGGTYVPPPPPPSPPAYKITGTQDGTYIVRDMGNGMSTISGTGNGTYTVTPQPDYTQLGYSLGLVMRQWKDRSHDKKLIQEAQKQIAIIDERAFKPQSPLLPGEVRQGLIAYWSGSTRAISPPFQVIMFFTDPTTNKEQAFTFEFR